MAQPAPETANTGQPDNGPGSAKLAWVGRLIAPPLALLVYVLLRIGADGLDEVGRSTAAIGVLMAVLWVTEAMPLPATALIPIALFPLAGIVSIGEATAPYASDVIFLFMGGFILALAMERWGLHRRIALHLVRLVGTKPTRLIAGFMLATAFLSMWISNTATTVLMLPIAVSVITLVLARLQETGHLQPPAAGEEMAVTGEGSSTFATCLVLGVAYAASIGSLSTLIGTPPNLFMRGFLEQTYGIEISFGEWMLVGVPLSAVFLVLAWLLLTRVIYPPEIESIPGGESLIQDEIHRLGPMTRGEWIVLAIFIGTALAWISREPLSNWEWLIERVLPVARLTDAGIAIIAAILLFAIPVDIKKGEQAIDWDTAKRLPWNALILFGGGLSLANAVQESGLDASIGDQVSGVAVLPTIGLLLVVLVVVILLTELTSNTATAATFLPILGGVALGVGVDPLLLVIPAALAASCAFMMPVATPPNVIVFGSGHVTIRQMVTAGVWLNLIAVGLITVLMYTVVRWVFGVQV